MNRALPPRLSRHPALFLLALLLIPFALHAQSGFPATHIAEMRTTSAVSDTDRAAGIAIFNLDRATNSARFRISVTNSSSPITRYLLVRHNPDGSSETLLSLPPLSYELTETGTLTSLGEEIINALDSMMLYVEIRSEGYPDGFIEGNITIAPNVVSSIFDSRRLPSHPEGSGEGTLYMLVDRGTGSAEYWTFWNRLSGPALEVQFRRAPYAQEGPVIHSVSDLKGDSVLIRHRWEGISPQNMQALISGEVYVIVTTAKYPGGEIGSQLATVDVFSAAIEPEQEVPPVTGSVASGTGYLTVLANPSFDYFFRSACAVHGTVDTIREGHIHQGEIGKNGPILRPLRKRSLNNWNLLEDISAQSLPPGTLANIRAGNAYFNFHTKSYPDGELRGQLIPSASNLSLVASAPRPEQLRQRAVTVFFDPRSDLIRFNLWEEHGEDIEIRLFSSLGERVVAATITEPDGALSAVGLRPGVYLAQLVIDGRVETVVPVAIVR